MKRTLVTLIILMTFGGVLWWVFTDHGPSLTADESFVTRNFFDPNPRHAFAMVTIFDSGATAAVETTLVNGKEVVKSVHIESRDGIRGEIDVRSNGLPWGLSVLGYTIGFESWRDTFADITITTPDGVVTSHADVEFPEPKDHPRISWMEAASASVESGYHGVDIPEVNRFGGEILDRQYYFDTLSLVWHSVSCGLGSLTNVIPDPVSVWATSLGCTSLVARHVPTPVDLGSCKDDDALFGCVKGVVSSSLGTDTVIMPFLFGSLTLESRPELTLQGVKIDIRHRSGGELRVVTDDVGRFGYGERGIPLGNGAYTVSVHGKDHDLQDQELHMEVSDLGLKIVVSETDEVIYDHVFSEGRLPPVLITMRSPAEERDWEGAFKDTKSKGWIEGKISIHQDADGKFTCTWSAYGTIDWSSETATIAGPFSMASEDCYGTAAEYDEEKAAYDVRLTGMQKGHNPIVSDSLLSTMVPSAAYADQKFVVEFRIRDDSLLGFIASDGDILSFADAIDWNIRGEGHPELANYRSDAALLFIADRIQ